MKNMNGLSSGIFNGKSVFLFFILFCASQVVNAQKFVGIGTDKPNPNAVLELNVESPVSNPQGFLLPRLTTIQRTLLGSNLNISTTGMSVYDLTDKTFYTWNGAQWNSTGSISIVGSGGIIITQSGNNFTIDGLSLANQWTTTGANIYYNSRVGIGTSIPGANLEVVGNPGLTALKVTPGASGFAGVDFQLGSTFLNITGSNSAIGGLTRINNSGSTEALSVINSGSGAAAKFTGAVNLFGNNSVTGIGYFGTIIGNNLTGFPGSIVTVDGVGQLGIGVLPTITLNTITGINGISVITGSGYDFTINGANFLTSLVGGNGISINKSGQLVTVTSNAVSSQFTTSGNNIATTYNTSVAGFITATGMGSFGTIIGNNLTGASGSVVTVDGAGKLGIGSIGSSQWITTTNGIYYTKSIGIGNVNPKSLIHVSSASGASIRVDASDAFTAIALNAISGVGALEYGPGGMEIKYNNTYSSTGDNSGATVVNIDNNQNVGIGTGGVAALTQKFTVVGNSSLTGIGYFGTIIGNNLSGASGSIVTVDGAGKLGKGLLPVATLNTISGINGISVISGTGYDFTINGSNFITSIVGGNGVSINKLGQLVTVTSTAISSQFTTSGSNIATTYNTSVAGFITATGIGSFGTIIGNNMAGAPLGSIVTVDGVGKLGYGALTSGIGGSGTATGIAYFTNNNTLTADGQNFTWDGTILGIHGSSIIVQGGAFNNFFAGSLTGNTTTAGANNNIFGLQSGNKLTSGNDNNVFGFQAGKNLTSGSTNNFMGFQAGFNSNGNSNNYFGYRAGFSNNGIQNNILGHYAGYFSTGSQNNFLGFQAAYNSTGSYNNIFGWNAGYDNTSGSSNVFIGNSAGRINTTGSGNIAIGSNTGYALGTFNNAIVLGNNASVAGSNMMMLGGIQGSGYEVKVGIGTALPSQELSVIGNTSATGIGYFGTIIGNNMIGAPVGSIVTVDGTGKLGYGAFPVSTNQWVSASANQIYTNSFVGIGNSNPTSILDIKQVTVTSSNTTAAKLDVSHGGGSGAKIASSISYSIAGIGATDSYKGLLLDLTGNNSAGTSANYGYALNYNVTGTRDAVGYVANMVSNTTGYKKGLFVNITGTGPQNIGLDVSVANGTINYAALFNGGNVGIGTSTPNQALVIAGNSSVTGTSFANDFSGKALTLAGIGTGLMTVTGSGIVTTTSINIPVSTFISTSTGMTYTNDKVAIGTNTVTGGGTFKVVGDASIGGALIAAQGFVNSISTSNNTYTDMISLPIYIPAGTKNLKGTMVAAVSATPATGLIIFNIDAGTATSTSNVTNITTTKGISDELVINVTALTPGWHQVAIQAKHNGTDSVVLYGFSLVIKD